MRVHRRNQRQLNPPALLYRSRTAVAARPAGPDRLPSDLRCLGQCQCIVRVHAEIPDGVFNLCVPEQDLDRAKVAVLFLAVFETAPLADLEKKAAPCKAPANPQSPKTPGSCVTSRISVYS